MLFEAVTLGKRLCDAVAMRLVHGAGVQDRTGLQGAAAAGPSRNGREDAEAT
jgi:hypothetical protein